MSVPRSPRVFRMGLLGGTMRFYAVQQRQDGSPSRFRITPQQAFGQITTIGDTVEVSDQRTSSMIFGTGGGMGRDKYVEASGLTEVRWSDWDTRFEDSAVLPLTDVALGANTLLTGTPVYVDWLGATNADLLSWVPRSATTTYAARYQASVWTTLVDSVGGTMYNLTSLTRYRGAYYLTSYKAAGSALYQSTNGSSWLKTGPAAALWHAACTHDNKWYGFNGATNEVWWTLDPTQPAGAAWLTSSETLELKPNEVMIQMAEWEDPSGRKCVMLLTNQRLLRFDDEARTFTQLDDFSAEIFSTGATTDLIPNMTVWKNDNNLYICFYDRVSASNNASTILQYTSRGQKGSLDPNKLSGLPDNRLVAISRLVGGLNYLFAFGNTPAGTSNLGQIFCWDGAGWHNMYTPPAGNSLTGGGYARGRLYAALVNGSINYLPYGDNRIRPEYRTETYLFMRTCSLYWARTTGGTDLLQKRDLWATVHCVKKDRTLGLESGCTLTLYQRLDGGAWTALGTATSAQAFPWQVDITPKGLWREMELRLDGYSGGSVNNTPYLRGVQYHFDRTPPDVRDVYDFVIDLGASVDTPNRGQNGRDSVAIAAELAAMRGQLVALEFGAGAFGGAPGKTSVATGLFQSAAEADPLTGEILFRCEVRDLTTPASG